jgi:hypothetical protein
MMTTNPNLLHRFRRHWISAVLFLVPLVLYLVGTLWFHLPELYQHVLLTITAVMGIHVLDRLFLIKDTEEALGSLVRGIQDDVSVQTASLLSASTSLEALDACGIVQVYPSRVEAAEDIKADVSDPANSQIRIMGISLNDFVQGMDHKLLEAWTTIQQFVRGQRRIDSEGLDIRVLIIDPLCRGAALRSVAESVSAAAIGTRLRNDVDAAAEALLTLERTAGVGSANVTFACRLYRLPPIMFLCWVDSVCYVQQYHFWSARDNRTPIPVLKFRNLPASGKTYAYHAEMRYHFDWIWENAAIPVSEYLDNAAVGTDAGTHGCATINIYGDPGKASERICHLLEGAQEKVSIQGISLHSYFKAGPLRKAISSVLEAGKAAVEVLLINPDSDQARFRSFRERLFVSPGEMYEHYISQGAHDNSDLAHDTRRTIDNIKEMIADLRRGKDATWKPRLALGLYDTAPACFVLRIDDRVLVEQYHYGKIAKETRAILGKDMPLVEYARMPDRISEKVYKNESNSLRRPFDLLVNHFEYVLAQASKVELFATVREDAAQQQPASDGATRRR